jgi:hypothetical protein
MRMNIRPQQRPHIYKTPRECRGTTGLIPPFCNMVFCAPPRHFIFKFLTSDYIATKARRHQGFIFNKTFCVTWCLCVLVAILPGG